MLRPIVLLVPVLLACLSPAEPSGVVPEAVALTQDAAPPVIVVAPNERLSMEPRIADLDFLEGTWLGSDGESSWESIYTSTTGGQVLGASKEMRMGRTIMIDFEHFYEREGKLRMTPYPFGNRSVEFTMTSFDAAKRQAVFENPEHDFPKKFTYQRATDKALRIELVGNMGGTPATIVLDLKLAGD
jgi:hypothetical protein